ncbi:hypothetical protein [Sinomonas sp. R1AF57]|uniref:hypothetical protein n=1 Tax=Sinomonas sp. R1AF57 TaxID=2020377 RepID=UPI002101B4B6|nr:hypothetical protein [Sinomonas sp. R1AF57]
MSTPYEQPASDSPEGQNPQGPNPYGQNPQGPNPYGQNPQGPNPYGQNPPPPPPPGTGPYGGAPGYQQPGYQQPGYAPPPGGQQQPGGQQPGGFRFEMPTDAPRSVQDVMPVGGFSGIFTTNGLPTELKVSYWIWLIGGALGVVFGLFGILAGLAALALAGAFGALLLVLVLIGLVLAAAQVILAMKMKEGRQWARLALSGVAALNLILAIMASGGNGGPNWFGALVSVTAAVLMWVPTSRAWFDGVARHA